MGILAIGLNDALTEELREAGAGYGPLDAATDIPGAMVKIRDAYLDEDPYRLVVVKMANEGFTGLELIEALRKFEQSGTHAVPVLCLVEDGVEASMLGLFARDSDVFADLSLPVAELLERAIGEGPGEPDRL